MTQDEKIELADAITAIVARDSLGYWETVRGIVNAIEPIIEKIVQRSRLEGATTVTKSLIG